MCFENIQATIAIDKKQTAIYVPDLTDYSKEYFTLHVLEDGNMTLYLPSKYSFATEVNKLYIDDNLLDIVKGFLKKRKS